MNDLHTPPPILGSMRPDGSRLKVYPADVRGAWITRRRLVFALLMAFYVFAPLVQIGGHPSVQLDFEHRRFFLFGHTFNAQDFWMVVLLALTFVFSLLFVTAWRGRIWCGWGCPQTVFLEGVYRPIERFFDGPRERRLRQKDEPWTASRVARWLGKQACFLFASVNIAHAAAAIFVGPRELFAMVREGPQNHWTAFFLTLGFAAVLQFNFAWFREQFCVVMCPYGRLQSVLHDADSITVAYDERRGEPRGKIVKNPPPGAAPQGDCIDCHRCVVVCPTAIDIRNGLQMECLACLQCVDACDEIMTKVGRPKGLITLLSSQELANRPRRVLRPRLAVYGGLALVASTVLAGSLLLRTPFESNVLRPTGGNPYVVDGDVVRNAFDIHLVNKNPEAASFEIRVTAPVQAEINVATPRVEVASLSDVHVPVSITIERSRLAVPVELELEIHDLLSGAVRHQTVRFLAPLGVAAPRHPEEERHDDEHHEARRPG